MQAHGLVERVSRDLDVATENPAPMDEIVASLTAGLTARGWRTTHVQTPYDPVLSLDDVIGTKVRALADRGDVRDLIDVRPPPATASSPTLKHSAADVPTMNSASKTFVTGSPARTGTRTRTTPPTD